ncbi:MAG: SMC-Scp complex subunit ScpB [Planctomycetes bacterium]|nr:SMC-Scp complex subunit ScpB [Planctomycetota bacterium]
MVEAVLFGSDIPLTPARLAEVADLPMKEVRKAVAELNERYEKMGCSFRIDSVAGGYQMLTLPEYHQVLERLIDTRKESRLTQASMETLAIVAYRQPIIRADVEAIRGVACGEVLRGLMEKQLVKIAGRAEVVGRPMLYGTTKHFLEVFGLNSLEDLPKAEELRGMAEKNAQARKSDQAPLPFSDQQQASDQPQTPQQTPASQNAETLPPSGQTSGPPSQQAEPNANPG